MNDIAQTSLNQSNLVDWENYGKTSSYIAPPVPVGPDGKYLTFYGVLGGYKEAERVDDFLNILFDPIKLVKSGQGVDGYEIRYTFAARQPYKDKNGNPKKGNPSKLADFVRAVAVQAKPQTDEEFLATIKLAASQNKPFPFTADWEARNRDTGEIVRGYNNFPEDPERPGRKLAILHAGDKYTVSDYKGNVTDVKVVQSEVLFANLKLRYFLDPSRVQK